MVLRCGGFEGIVWFETSSPHDSRGASTTDALRTGSTGLRGACGWGVGGGALGTGEFCGRFGARVTVSEMGAG